jgi:catechol 2,3-dioxygenase-like lactoylglutathione lyase family enzyme
MDQRLSLVTLGVADLKRARAFYEGGLGWRPADVPGEGIAFYQVGSLALALYPWDALAADAQVPAARGGFAGITLAWNGRSKADVDDVLVRAVAAGAKLVKPAQEVFWGGYSGYFADPDGHLWEVAFNPFFPLAADGALVLPQPAP